MDAMQKNGKKVLLQVVSTTIRGSHIDHNSLNELKNVLNTMKEQVRIFIFMAYTQDLRNMLIMSLDLGMLNGEYAFLTNEFALTGIFNKQTFRPEADEVIWNGILAAGLYLPSGERWEKFCQEVIDTFQDPRFSHLPHMPSTASVSEVNVYAGRIPYVYITLIPSLILLYYHCFIV